MNAPAATNGTRPAETVTAPTIPIATAPTSADHREGDERAVRQPRAQRPAVELVQRVRAHADAEEERAERRGQPVARAACGAAAAPIAT